MNSFAKASLVLVVLFVATLGFAQSPAATPTPDPEAIESNVGVRFETFADVVRLSAGGNGTRAGFRIPILPRWSGKAYTLLLPTAAGGFDMGALEYRERADHISFLKGKQFLFPLNAIQFHAEVGLGQRRADGKKPEFAYSLEGGLDIAVAQVGSSGKIVIQPGLGYIGSGALNRPQNGFKFGNSGLFKIGAALKF